MLDRPPTCVAVRWHEDVAPFGATAIGTGVRRDPSSGLSIPKEDPLSRMNRGLLRQGDVLLVPVDALPVGVVARPRGPGRLVLAQGEATGHAHVIAEPGCELSVLPVTRERFLSVLAEAGVTLAHEEHGPIAVAPGLYEVHRQREYQPRRPARWVAD